MKEDTNGGGGAEAAAFVSGVAAGFLSTFAGHPFEVIKTRLQIRDDLKTSRWPSWNMAQALLRSDQPHIAFARGFTSNAIGNAVGWGGFFAVKAVVENSILSFKSDPSAEPSTASSEKQARLSSADTFIAASVAGYATQILANPIFVVKTRMLAVPRGSPNAYLNTVDAILKIYRNEGWKAFYSGVGISIFGVVQVGLQFVMYDYLKDQYRISRKAKGIIEGSEEDQLTHAETTIISTISKTVSITAMYPYQVIRTRMQMTDAKNTYGDGIIGVITNLRKEKQVRAFYKGLGPAIVRTLPATWVTFLVYEDLKPFLQKLFTGTKDGEGQGR
ncbi:mitochondrial FAD carrier protein flx1 [Gnomoniopsis sp. IMI 355080]|nr:mitochondrial FAD carrier protein flx1 [Gnomoniopsis sp. IMI 355080]